MQALKKSGVQSTCCYFPNHPVMPHRSLCYDDIHFFYVCLSIKLFSCLDDDMSRLLINIWLRQFVDMFLELFLPILLLSLQAMESMSGQLSDQATGSACC